jgi:hypothetical protein
LARIVKHTTALDRKAEMDEAKSNLVVEPALLQFRFELRKAIPVTLSLNNPTGSARVAFKVIM